MAQKYHPLDVRYTGPSTAYRGKPKTTLPRNEHVSLDDTKPAESVVAEVWARPASSTPPPLPTLPTAKSAAPRRRNSGLRVLIGAAILIFIVGANIYATRHYSGLMSDVEGSLQTISIDDL